MRLAQFFSGRSLWHDEALFALNLVQQPIRDVTGRLDFGQAAPLPFTVIEWMLARPLGYSEEALRLFPLLTGIASLGVFAVFARRFLEPWAAAIGTSFFALADGLVFYSSELKPYSSDVLVTTLLLLVAATAVTSTPTFRRGVLLGLCGGIAILFSYPSVFVAVPAVLVLVLAGWHERARGSLRGRVALAVPWAVAVIGVTIDARARAGRVREDFGLEPVSYEMSTIASGLDYFNFELLDLFVFSLFESAGFAQERPFAHVMKLVACVLLLGLLMLVRRRPSLGILTALPFASAFVASALGLYPVTERTTLFLLPCVIILLAEGLAWPLRAIRRPAGALIAGAAVAIVFAFPLYSAVYHVVHPREREEMGPVLQALSHSWQPGDGLYLHPRAQYAFRYYARCNCLDTPRSLSSMFPFEPIDGEDQSSPSLVPTREIVLGETATDPVVLRRQLARLDGRVWVLHSHLNSAEELEFVETVMPRVLDEFGTRRKTIRRKRATAYLYELA